MTAAGQAYLSITNSRSLLKLMFIKSVMPSNHLVFCCPLILLPSIFPSIRVFSNESVLPIRWSNWSFSFSISPSNEYSGWISFKMDWFALLAVQGTLKSRLQNHGSKASILQCSSFFMVQLSHPYMTTEKNHKMDLCWQSNAYAFYMLSTFVKAFLAGSKCPLISQLQSPSAVILQPKKIKSLTSHCFPICWPGSDGTGCHNLRFLNVEF